MIAIAYDPAPIVVVKDIIQKPISVDGNLYLFKDTINNAYIVIEVEDLDNPRPDRIYAVCG